MTDYLITIDEVAKFLGYQGRTAKKNAGSWLSKHKIVTFGGRKGVYLKDSFWNAFEEEKQKCLQLEKSGNTTISGEQYVWQAQALKCQKNPLALLNSKMRESMQAG
jgi:hypothetical protein